MLLLLACAPPSETGAPAGDDVQPLTSDVVSAKLTETTDLCAWEDGELAEAEPVEVEEGYIDDPWTNLYQPCLDGLFHVMGRILEHPDGHIEAAAASATFFTVTEVGHSWIEGAWIDPVDGVDDCGLVVTGWNGLETLTDLRWLDPGAVDLLAPSGTTPLARYEGGFALNWESTAAPAEYGSYGLDVAGSTGSGDWDGFDAIALPDLVTLPEALTLTSPAGLGPGVALARADTELVWTGSSDALVEIRLHSSGEDADHELRCDVTDDGAFTLPGSLLAQFPADATATLKVARREETWVGTREGRSVHAIGFTDYEAWDLVIP